MKIVMTYTAGDGYTYSCDVALPIVYESPEAAIVDFEAKCLAAHNAPWPAGMEFSFAGQEFTTNSFMIMDETDSAKAKFYAPDFLTVDEWFAQASGS